MVGAPNSSAPLWDWHNTDDQKLGRSSEPIPVAIAAASVEVAEGEEETMECRLQLAGGLGIAW